VVNVENYLSWLCAGAPGRERYGITVDPQATWVRLDNPGSVIGEPLPPESRCQPGLPGRLCSPAVMVSRPNSSIRHTHAAPAQSCGGTTVSLGCPGDCAARR